MKSQAVLIVCVVLLLTELIAALPYLGDEDDDMVDPDELGFETLNLDRLLQTTQKRSCQSGGHRCNWASNDCCYGASCKCNFWGQNCKCQRKGLFQWGKPQRRNPTSTQFVI